MSDDDKPIVFECGIEEVDETHDIVFFKGLKFFVEYEAIEYVNARSPFDLAFGFGSSYVGTRGKWTGVALSADKQEVTRHSDDSKDACRKGVVKKLLAKFTEPETKRGPKDKQEEFINYLRIAYPSRSSNGVGGVS